LEGAELDDEGVAEVDAILADMNDELMTHADTLMEIYVSGREPTPREMLAISRDVTAILDDAQADLDRSLGAEAAAQLDKLQNLIYLGRPGRFRYTNQDHSLEMGITACQMIVEGRKYDLDAIGSENEYFEKGPVYEKRI
jgi:hypothetical protein